MKKTFKKLMAALLAVALLCVMAVPAFAAEGASGTSTGSGSITINNARANAVLSLIHISEPTRPY